MFFALRLLSQLEELQTYMKTAMSEVFYPDAVDEWLSTIIKPKIQEVSKVLSTASELLQIGARPKQLTSMDQT